MEPGFFGGAPKDGVLLGALLGALVAVWIDQQRVEVLSFRWIGRALGVLFVSTLAGVAGAEAITALTDEPLVGVAGKLPPRVTAFVVAALIHLVGPVLLRRFIDRRGGPAKEDHHVGP